MGKDLLLQTDGDVVWSSLIGQLKKAFVTQHWGDISRENFTVFGSDIPIKPIVSL